MSALGPRRRRLAATVVAALVAGSVLVACGSDKAAAPNTAPSTPQAGSDPSTTAGAGTSASGSSTTGGTTSTKVEATVVADVDQPTVLLPRPGDDDHLYVAERVGRIRRLKISTDGKTLTRDGDTLLDLTKQTTTESERGLLGLAFSADGDTIYVSYTNPDGNTRLVSYAMDGDAIDASTQKVLLAQEQPYPNHNGGDVVLGPDGKLWFGLGDGGSGDDPENHAQDPDSLLGKVMTITPGEKPQIQITGVRNPWRFAFDTDGSLWIGDVGQDHWEEIDHLAKGHIAGVNLGWSGYEGTHENANATDPSRRPKDRVDPVFEYSHDGGNCSITGGFPYHGKALPSLDGAYLFADYCAGNLRAVKLDAKGKLGQEIDLHIHIDSPVSFGADQDGEPYVLSQGGSISKLVPGT